MPARTLAFASLLLATGLNTVVGNSAEEAAACSNGGLSTFCTNACPPSATTCGKQLDGSTRLTDATAPGSCADCTTGWAATGTDDCIAHTTCGKQLDGSTRAIMAATATAPGSCADCTAGWVDWNNYDDNSGTFDCIAHTTCGKQLDGLARDITLAGNPKRDTVCAECYPHTWASADAEDCRGGECGYQWGGAVRHLGWFEGDFTCEPCTTHPSLGSMRTLVLPLFLPDGTDIGYDTGYCAPETCKEHCFYDATREDGYAGYESTFGS